MKLIGQLETNIAFIKTSVRLNLMIVHDLFFSPICDSVERSETDECNVGEEVT